MSGLVVHIGMAKAFSTSIQACLAALPGANYAGLYPDFPNRRWYRAEIEGLFDRTLRFADERRFAAAQSEAQAFFEAFAREAAFNVVSSENLTLRFIPNDLPTDVKLARLARLLPAGARLFVVHRSTRALLRSLYKEYVLFGDARSFEEFVAEAVRYRAINFFDDLLLGELLSRIDDAFGLERLVLCPAASQRIEACLASLAGVSAVPLTTRNASMSDTEAVALARFNETASTPVTFEAMVELHRAYSEDASIPDDARFALARRKKRMMGEVERASRSDAAAAFVLSASINARLDEILLADQALIERYASAHPHIAEGLTRRPA